MKKLLKVAVLVVELQMSWHGHAHPRHEEHAPESRVERPAIIR